MFTCVLWHRTYKYTSAGNESAEPIFTPDDGQPIISRLLDEHAAL
jgi:hypothetical protein